MSTEAGRKKRGGFGGKPGPGRHKGIPNRVTADVRAAFADFVAGNVGKFQKWLDGVAEGEKEPRRRKDGSPILGTNGKPLMKWLRQPDPGYALRLVADIAEYHIPKLARTEHTGPEGERLESVQLVFVGSKES